MAYALEDKYAKINDYRKFTLHDIWDFNQLTGLASNVSQYKSLNQDDREVIARALTQAMNIMARHLGFYTQPTFITEEIKLGKAALISGQSHKLSYGHIQALGAKGLTALDEGSTITYSDVQAIGTEDTGTVSFTDSATDLSEIKIFFTITDGAPAAADARFEIPIKTIARSGSTVTITFHRANAVKPNGLWSQPYDDVNYLSKNIGTNSDDDLYVTTLDIYRVYADSTDVATYMGSKYDRTLEKADGGAQDTTAGTAYIENAELGIVRIQPVTASSFSSILPEKVQIKYYAGYPLMDSYADPHLPEPMLNEAVMRLANLERAIDTQGEHHPRWFVFKDDEKLPGRDNPVQPGLLNNPLGIKNGHVAVWKIIREWKLPDIVTVTSRRRKYY